MFLAALCAALATVVAAAPSLTSSVASIDAPVVDAVITWADVTNANAEDWIAVTCTGASYFYWLYASGAPNGSTPLRLFANSASSKCASLTVVYYHDNAVILSTAAMPIAPMIQQIRLSMTSEPTEMVVDFVSSGPGASASCSWGPSATALSSHAAATTSFYATIGNASHALLTGLSLGVPTFYACSDGVVSSGVYSFTAAPNGLIAVAVFADFGVNDGFGLDQIAADAAAGAFDLALHAGDWAYDLETDNSANGNFFMNRAMLYSTSKPTQPAPGNHEAGNDFFEYQYRHLGVAAHSNTNSSLYYSFDVSPNTPSGHHVLVFNSETYIAGGIAAMLAFMRSDLSSVDRKRTPWVIAYSHKLWWMDATDFTSISVILQDGGCDVLFAGHWHYYARYLPYNPITKRADTASVSADAHTYKDPLYVTMIVSGAPGDVERNDDCPGDAALKDIVPTCTPQYGYGTYKVMNATHLYWQFTAKPTPIGSGVTSTSNMRRAFRSQAGYDDHLWIVKTGGARPSPPPTPPPTLTVTPDVATSSPTTFTVTWSSIPNAASNDWIAQYCEGADGPSGFGPWAYATGAASGSMRLTITSPLVQAPCDAIVFAYYRDPSPYTFVVASNVVPWNVTSPSATTPRHMRLAYGSNARTEMHVSFTTEDGVTPALIQLTSTSGSYVSATNISTAAAITYAADDSCGAPSAWSPPGFFHHALLTGLTPATRYWARAVQGGSVGAETTFVSGKELGPDVPVRAIVFADMSESGGDGAVSTAAHVTARVLDVTTPIDFLLHVGDLSYGEGNVGVWESFMSLIAPVSAAVPYHVSIGNHEYDYAGGDGSKDPSGAGQMWRPTWWNGGNDGGGECGMPTSRRFRTPSNGNGVFWYSFEVGSIHVTMLSSEHDPSPGAAMGDWLASDLAGVNRSVTPWLIVNIHRPLVETEMYKGDFDVAAGLRAIMEPLLLQWGVDVVIAGHYHSFQRSCSMARLECVANGGIVHYTTGAAGASLDAVDLYPSSYIAKTILGKYGYSVLEANATTLTLSFHENAGDTVLDFVALSRRG